MATVATYHPLGTATVSRQQVLQGQTSPILYSDVIMGCNCYQSIFKKIRRKFAVFPRGVGSIINVQSIMHAYSRQDMPFSQF